MPYTDLSKERKNNGLSYRCEAKEWDRLCHADLLFCLFFMQTLDDRLIIPTDLSKTKENSRLFHSESHGTCILSLLESRE